MPRIRADFAAGRCGQFQAPRNCIAPGQLRNEERALPLPLPYSRRANFLHEHSGRPSTEALLGRLGAMR